jgi:branched-chain amino acid transport system substrate-binding protein
MRTDTGQRILLLFLIVVLLSGFPGCAKKETAIRIGAILPLTGDAAKYGKASKQGIELGLEEINASGGIQKKKLEVIYEDDQADPRLGVSAFEKLITVNKVPVVIGPLPSSVALAVAPLAEKNKVILLSPAASSPALTNAGDYVFRNVVSDLFEGMALAEFVYSHLHLRNVSIIYINNDFGVGLKNSFSEKFEGLGGKIITTESFNQGSTDFRTQLSKIKTGNPQGIYLIGYREMGRILRQATELGIRAQFLSIAMFEDPEILKIAGESAEGIYYSFRAYDPQSGDELVKKFVKDYMAKYTVEPDIFAALSYDAIRIISLAIRNVGTNPDAIKKFLYTVKDFPGVTGKITFDKNGDIIGTMSIKMVKDGKFVWYIRNYPVS